MNTPDRFKPKDKSLRFGILSIGEKEVILRGEDGSTSTVQRGLLPHNLLPGEEIIFAKGRYFSAQERDIDRRLVMADMLGKMLRAGRYEDGEVDKADKEERMIE